MLVLVTQVPLDEAAARAHVTKPENGAVLLFLGIVRDRHEGRAVSRLEYSAYVPMAERELAAVARRAAEKHGVRDVAVLHRIGTLNVGDVSLVVAVGSEHRREAFAAGLELIDTLKERVPIWKKEFGPGGEHWQEGVLPGPPGPDARPSGG